MLLLLIDLEYHKDFNAGVDGDSLVGIVLKLCAEQLQVDSALPSSLHGTQASGYCHEYKLASRQSG